jgi:hypothetical protein
MAVADATANRRMAEEIHRGHHAKGFAPESSREGLKGGA